MYDVLAYGTAKGKAAKKMQEETGKTPSLVSHVAV